VDLARLSLWLATLAKDHEFTFLDHALKGADSLTGLDSAVAANLKAGAGEIGLSLQQISNVTWGKSRSGLPIARIISQQRLEEIRQLRKEIREARESAPLAELEVLNEHYIQATDRFRDLGDSIVAAFFLGKTNNERERVRRKVEEWASAFGDSATQRMRDFAREFRLAHPHLVPFHWELELPEVFDRENPGFDAIVGNPPFAGKNTIIKATRAGYLNWLKEIHPDAHGNADIVAHFFRRSFALLRRDGTFGLIATNTIAQGDTRETGLAAILSEGGSIARATRRLKWPGEAAVTVSVIHLSKGAAPSPIVDKRRVRRISAYLVEGDLDHAPAKLTANDGLAFNGTKIYGQGFIFDDIAANTSGTTSTLAEMAQLIANNACNESAIKPYVGGDEITSDPTHSHYRYVINFDNLGETEARSTWPDLMQIVERLVKPGRLRDNRKGYRQYWWRYGERRVRLYNSIANLARVLANSSKATPHHAFAFIGNGKVYSQNLNVFSFEMYSAFCPLQSRSHETWARFVGTSFEDRLTYVTDDCFKTFPLPKYFETSIALEATGQAYHHHRAALMVARNEGMTKTYNRFHDRAETVADIVRLRELHAEMDRAVLGAYGWHDLAERAAPVFLDESTEDDHTYQGRLFWPSDFRDEVLARLLALNADRHVEEVRLGIAPGMKGGQREGEDGEEASEDAAPEGMEA
ncbi:MAG: Eco57I restriction-modification methylase domain-containing protein, partial [Candidatus Binataceae bacterium]